MQRETKPGCSVDLFTPILSCSKSRPQAHCAFRHFHKYFVLTRYWRTVCSMNSEKPCDQDLIKCPMKMKRKAKHTLGTLYNLSLYFTFHGRACRGTSISFVSLNGLRQLRSGRVQLLVQRGSPSITVLAARLLQLPGSFPCACCGPCSSVAQACPEELCCWNNSLKWPPPCSSCYPNRKLDL